MMKLRFAEPRHLIDLGRIPALRGIEQVGGEIRIGAMTTEHQLLNSPLLAQKVPLLVEGAGWIADPHAAKPGVYMPASPDIDGASLRALAAYLESLK